jgi:hypothetical protein
MRHRGQPLTHALRKVTDPHGGHFFEPDLLERRHGQSRVDVVQPAGEAQVLGGGKVSVQACLMAQQIGPRTDGASVCPQVEAKNAPVAEGR